MNRYLHYAYILFIGVALMFIVASFWDTPLQPGNGEMTIIEPVSITQTGEYEREFLFDVAGLKSNRNDISFFTKHQYASLYADNELIYTYNESGGIWGHTPGAYWVFADVPEDTSEVKVVLNATYDMVKEDVPTFYLGNELTSYQAILRKSVIPFLVSVLIMVYGLVLLIYWKTINHRFGGEKSLFYLGSFAALIGLFLANETDAVIMILRHRVGCIAGTYILLMLLVPTSICFVKEFLGTVETVIWKLICVCSAVEFVVCVLLQILGIMDLRQTLVVTHILIVVATIYTIITLVIKIMRKEFSASLRASLISLVVICLTAFASLTSYYGDTSVSDTGVVSRLGFMIFILVLSVEALKHSLNLMEKGRVMEVYKELAVLDMLTGLSNRNAYISDIDGIKDYTDIMIVTFDLNNLKKCNDNRGHKEGDKYLLSAANMIREVFGLYGNCYRIGGDEFCVLIKGASNCPIKELLDKLEQKMLERNRNAELFPMYISYGYAVFDDNLDLNIEKTRDRADALMYEHKRRSKEGL